MDNDDIEIIGAIVDLLNEQAAEEENVAQAAARLAAQEMMELEEGEGFGAAGGPFWTNVRVFIEDYHLMGDISFRLHFRMSRVVFQELVNTVRNHLIQMYRLRRERTPMEDIMLMVVWLLATPDSFRSVSLRFGVNPGTLYSFYKSVIEALRELSAIFIKWPSEEERTAIANTFERATGFPGVIGSIDCTHVTITAPVNYAAQYINRHHQYSINVQAVIDADLLVRQLHVGEPGSMNDNRVFRRSPLRQDLLNEPPGVTRNLDQHLVGDGAYTLTDYMLVPFPNNGHLTPQELNFNRRLSQCRVRVENGFARGKGKWRRLKFMHARNPSIVTDHITASFVLHNFVILNGEALWDENELERPINDDDDILPGEEFNEDEPQNAEGEYDELQEAAEARGAEKRLFIMNDILWNAEV